MEQISCRPDYALAPRSARLDDTLGKGTVCSHRTPGRYDICPVLLLPLLPAAPLLSMIAAAMAVTGAPLNTSPNPRTRNSARGLTTRDRTIVSVFRASASVLRRVSGSAAGFLRNLGRNTGMRRFGRRLERAGKRLLRRALDVVLPVPANEPLGAIGIPRRLLLVRPNFRIGNTLISAPLIKALHERFPEARIDYLGADTTAILLRHFPVDRVYCISRRFVLRPWELIALLRRIRREHYDVAVDAGMGSTSSGFYTFFTGARHRIGVTGAGERFLTTRVPAPRVSHAYDAPVAFAAGLGVSCADRPAYVVDPEELAAARDLLSTAGLAAATAVTPFVALSISGHKDKRLAVEIWVDLAARLIAAGGRVVVLTGPEEVALLPRLRHELPAAIVLPPQPLRQFAATLSLATLVVAPDSGPLHLSVAVGVPTIALLIASGSRRYAPRGREDRVVFPATAAAAAQAVTGHPRWAAGGLRA